MCKITSRFVAFPSVSASADDFLDNVKGGPSSPSLTNQKLWFPGLRLFGTHTDRVINAKNASVELNSSLVPHTSYLISDTPVPHNSYSIILKGPFPCIAVN